jgi:hypothetical protein
MSIRGNLKAAIGKPVAHEVDGVGTVYLHRVKLGELDELQKGGDSKLPMTARMLALFAVDDNDVPLYDMSKPEDVAEMLALPVDVAADILRAGNKLNRLEDAGGNPNA